MDGGGVPTGSDEDGQSNQALIVRSYHSIDKSFESSTTVG
jgi:hypothetical protein